MATAKLLEKRKNHIYMLGFFTTKALEMDENSSQSEIVLRMGKLTERFDSFLEILHKLENQDDYADDEFLQERVNVEEDYIRGLAKLQELRNAKYSKTSHMNVSRNLVHYELPSPSLEISPVNATPKANTPTAPSTCSTSAMKFLCAFCKGNPHPSFDCSQFACEQISKAE